MAAGCLYVVGTPIGNRADLSPRARETLERADVICCEDTRHTGILLKLLGIAPRRLASYHQHSKLGKVEQIVAWLGQGLQVALVSDAGMPGIADPGNLLVAAVRRALPEVAIVAVPGPAALTALASVSGLPTDSFLFLGFLPHKKGRQTALERIAASQETVFVYESVHRIAKLLGELEACCGSDRYVVVGRELTKKFEHVYAGLVHDVAARVLADPVKGEYVVAVAGALYKLPS